MTEQQQRVNTLIARVEEHQKALKLSDLRFVARYQRYLRSTKSWRDRLCARDWAEIGRALGKWEERLTAFVTELDGAGDMPSFVESLPIYRHAEAQYDALQGQQTDRRCSFLIGPTGVGKSWSMRRLNTSNLEKTCYLHVNKGWHDRMGVIAASLAEGIGASEKRSAAGTFNEVVKVLKGHPITLLIDDVHEGGVLMLKLIKHIIDDTRAKFILGTYPTGWTRLVNGSTDAQAEAQQLLGRTIKPVNLTWTSGVTEEDVAEYLRAACGVKADKAWLGERIVPVLRRHGNFRLLSDALELAGMNVGDEDDAIDAELIASAVERLAATAARK